MFSKALATVIALAWVVRLQGATLTVDLNGGADYTTIQPALDAAVSSDVVLVKAGEYVLRAPIRFGGKAVALRSESGPEVTVLRMGDELLDPRRASVVRFEQAEPEGTTLEGFTLTGGRGSLHSTDPYGVWGGGIVCGRNCSPSIVNCIIADNHTSPLTVDQRDADGLGSGVFCEETSTPSFIRCVFARNSATTGGRARGGAVDCNESTTVAFTECIFRENSAHVGGAIYAGQQTAITADACIFERNTARVESSGSGGALTLSGTTATLTGCTFQGNRSDYMGGAMVLSANMVMTNCTFHGNHAVKGAVVVHSAGRLELTNCTVAGNAAAHGGAFFFSNSPTRKFLNCIISGNSGGSIEVENFLPLTSMTVDYSCVEGDDVLPGVGNLNQDPRFRGWGQLGEVYVDAGAPAQGTGSEDAPFTDLDAATEYGLELGPDSPCRGTGQGGANMGSDTGLSDVTGVATRLVHIREGAYAMGPADCVHGVSLRGAGSDATTITGTVWGLSSGAAIEDVTVSEGGPVGIYVSAGESPRITRCAVVRNTSRGIACYPGSRPTIGQCLIAENVGTGNWSFGGGLFCFQAEPLFVDCTIKDNSCSRGGGVYLAESPATFRACKIQDNSADYTGGVHCYGRSSPSPTFDGCWITGNRASYDGGGIGCVYDARPTFFNCVIAGNIAESDGAVYMDRAYPKFTNCTFTENHLLREGRINCEFSAPEFVNCIWWANTSRPACGTLTKCLVDRDPLFLAPGRWNDSGTPADASDDTWTIGDYHLTHRSPAIDAGTSEGAPTTDIEGTTRPCRTAVDIGAYEYCSSVELALASGHIAECAPAHVLGNLTNLYPVQIFSFGVAHDPAVATLIAIDFLGCPVIQALNGSQGPDFFGVDLNPGTANCAPEVTAGGTVYCIASQNAPSTETIPAGTDQPIARLTYEAVPGNAPGTESPLAIVGCLGEELPREVVVTIDGLSYTPASVGGTLTVAAAACRFVRGDANGDRRVDISDVVTLLMYMFEGGRGPLRCEDASDANDDGALDIADLIRILGRLFAQGTPFDPPYPGCGTDPTVDTLVCGVSTCE